MSERFYCTVKPMTAELKVIHREGLPGEGEVMGWPVFLVTYPDPEGGVLLYRIAPRGDIVGDTWHETLEYAREQAVFEYGDSLEPWKPIPDESANAVDFVIALTK